MRSFLYVLTQTGAIFVLGFGASAAAVNGEVLVALFCVFGWIAGAYFIWQPA